MGTIRHKYILLIFYCSEFDVHRNHLVIKVKPVTLIILDFTAKSRHVYFSSAWVALRTVSGTVVGSLLVPFWEPRLTFAGSLVEI